MTIWFGPFIDLGADPGYFHVCPACYKEWIQPHMDQVQGRLMDLHPLAQHLALTGTPEEGDLAAQQEDGLAAQEEDGPAAPEGEGLTAGGERLAVHGEPAEATEPGGAGAEDAAEAAPAQLGRRSA